MTADFTNLIRKIVPDPGGEDVLKLRVGILSAVNSDGTADIYLSGVLVEDVPRLQGVTAQQGALVQVLSYRGSLLIIGQSAETGATAGAGLWTRVRSTSSSASMTTSLATVLTTTGTTFLRNRVYEIRSHGGVQTTSAGGLAQLRAYRSGGAILGEWYRFPCTVADVTFNATVGGMYFAISNAGNVGGAVELRMAMSAGNGIHYANTDQERNLEIWDVGEISQFPGVQTW